MRMPVKWPYLISLILFLGILFYLFYSRVENFFLFYPQSAFDFRPEEMQLVYKDVYFDTDDGKRLHGWFFKGEEKGPVILFCHGNAGNISHRLDNIRRLLGRGVRVFIFDYRGYGRSEGRPSETGIYKDGLAACDWLVRKARIPADHIILFGRSLGAAVAVDIALKREVRSLIIESAFTSTKEMAKTMLPFRLFAPLLPANYNNLEKIPHVSKPKLIIHGDEDRLVPFHMGEKLFETAKAPKYFYRLRGAGHNDTYEVGGENYFKTIEAFIKDSKIEVYPENKYTD